MTRQCCCGLIGRSVDVLESCQRKMTDLQEKVRAARKEALEDGGTPSW